MGCSMIGADTTHEDLLTERYDDVAFYVDLLHTCIFETDNEEIKVDVSDKDLIRSLSGLRKSITKFEQTFGLQSCPD